MPFPQVSDTPDYGSPRISEYFDEESTVASYKSSMIDMFSKEDPAGESDETWKKMIDLAGGIAAERLSDAVQELEAWGIPMSLVAKWQPATYKEGERVWLCWDIYDGDRLVMTSKDPHTETCIDRHLKEVAVPAHLFEKDIVTGDGNGPEDCSRTPNISLGQAEGETQMEVLQDSPSVSHSVTSGASQGHQGHDGRG